MKKNSIQDLEEQSFKHLMKHILKTLKRNLENINDFEDWLVIDSEVLFQRDGMALIIIR